MPSNSNNVEIISPEVQLPFLDSWFEIATEDHFWMQWRLQAAFSQFRRLHIPLEKFFNGIEIGCGHGVLRKQLERETNWIISGVDLDLKALRDNPSGRGKLYLYNIFDQSKDFENRFDFLILYDVLEHIADTQNFLKACLFHIKPQGYIFLNVPALNILYSRYDTVVGHHRRYTKKSLSQELQKSDLEILDISYWGFSLIPLLLARKLTISIYRDTSKIVKFGFKPPSPFFNGLFFKLMRIENKLIKKPLAGTSLLAVVKKK